MASDKEIPEIDDPVNAPRHYRSHPSGIECIQITEHMGFNLGNVIKYLWRAEEKGDPIENLKKAAWYLNREILRREKL
jgi:hypothetical protein